MFDWKNISVTRTTSESPRSAQERANVEEQNALHEEALQLNADYDRGFESARFAVAAGLTDMVYNMAYDVANALRDGQMNPFLLGTRRGLFHSGAYTVRDLIVSR